MIDLVLAGDNAIVIALAARQLPAHLQTKAIVWGTVGAIVVRSVMTVGVVWLLKIPGLMLVGGLGLVWIAYKLLAPQSGHGEGHAPVATTFWGAMKTIVIADALMGVDNVLGVAGAAKGSFDLGDHRALISVPIVVWCSRLVLKLVERLPIITYVGAGAPRVHGRAHGRQRAAARRGVRPEPAEPRVLAHAVLDRRCARRRLVDGSSRAAPYVAADPTTATNSINGASPWNESPSSSTMPRMRVACCTPCSPREAAHWIVVACPPTLTRHVGRWVSKQARRTRRERWADELFAQIEPVLRERRHRGREARWRAGR